MRPSSKVTPPVGPMVGMRPYLLSVGQSWMGIRSIPQQPSRAASRHTSSNGILGSKLTRMADCFSRPLCRLGGSVCAATTPAAAAALNRSLRRMGALYTAPRLRLIRYDNSSEVAHAPSFARRIGDGLGGPSGICSHSHLPDRIHPRRTREIHHARAE